MCKVCDNYNFNNVGVEYNEILKHPTVFFPSQIGDVPKDKQFRFCPACGKPLINSSDAKVTFGDLRKFLQDHTTVWLETEDGEYIDSNELKYIDKKYDECEIVLAFPEKYPAISSFGLTVFLKDAQ